MNNTPPGIPPLHPGRQTGEDAPADWDSLAEEVVPMIPTLEGFAPLLQVFDMPRSLAFYRDVLGFTVAASNEPGDNPDWVLLRRDGIELMLNTMYERDDRPSAPPPHRATAHRDTGLYFGCRDLDAACAHLRACGVDATTPATAPYGMRQVWASDPDGYAICLQWPA